MPQGIDREAYPVDPDATIRTFADFAADCQASFAGDILSFLWLDEVLDRPELKVATTFAWFRWHQTMGARTLLFLADLHDGCSNTS